MSNPWDNDPVVGGKTSSPEEFAQVYGPVAERISKAIGVDKAVVLGQLGLETGWGKSIIPGTHNLGNIKDFAGGGVGATDNMTGSKDKYRAYATPEAFADDYASLIQRKYPGAVNAGSDASKFTTGLKGYAEDPRYPTKVAAAAKIAGAKTGNPWDNDPIVEPEASPAPSAAGGATGSWDGEQPGKIASLGAGVGKGVGTVALGAQRVVGKGLNAVDSLLDSQRNLSSLVTGQPASNSPLGTAGEWLVNDADQGRAKLASENAPYKAANPITNVVGEVGGNIAATYPVGGLLGAGAKALGATRLGTALATGGATTGAPVAAGIAPGTANMLLRMAGGAGTGAASAGLIDPNSIGTGAAVGAALPPILSGVGAVARTAGSLIRPFTSGGQERIAGNVLRDLATDPAAARTALQSAAPVVPGSAPTAVTASGDAGIAALSRTMQNASPEYAANLAARQTAQNQARTAAMEGIAGNTGKIEIAKQARNAATGTMREEALSAAGKVPAQGILQQIDNLIADPNNAGQLSQQALNQFKSRIAANAKDGAVDARALYAIRKDINDVLGGKLQGEAGNLKYAASQLSGIKGFIDDAIDQASRSMPANAIGPTTRGAPNWKGYLQKYADESIPINQMEKLEDVLKSIQTSTVDSQGSAIISAAKLNNILKNKGGDLIKELSPAQLQVLRNIQADLNAGQIANNVGRAVGSNTVQNLAQNQLLESALGRTLGGSTAASSTLGRLLQIPYGTANKQIQERLGNALLDPKEAAALLADPKNNALLQALTQSQLPYRAAPAISAR